MTDQDKTAAEMLRSDSVLPPNFWNDCILWDGYINDGLGC